jgi:hypothetical protein
VRLGAGIPRLDLDSAVGLRIVRNERKEGTMSDQRIAIIGKLRAGSLARAEEIIEEGPPFELGGSGIARHSVFVCSDFVVFVFEGPDIEYGVHRLVDHPVVAASFGVWWPVLEATPRLAHERFFWETSPNGRARSASGAQP